MFRTERRNYFWKRYYFKKRLPWRLARATVLLGMGTFAYYWHRRD